MHDISTDHGSVLPPDASALVVSGAGEFSFFIADYSEDQDLPRMVQLLAAVLLRSTDDEWVEDMLATFDKAPRS